MDFGKDLVAASATPLVLAILAEGDSYGYAIIKRVAELSGGHLQWTDGMLYPGAAPARAAGSCRGEVGRVRKRPQAQVLPHHQRGPGAARGPAAAVAGRGQHPAGYLDEGVPGMTTVRRSRRSKSRSRNGGEYLRRRQAIHGPDVEELEGHLRDQVAALTEAGLAGTKPSWSRSSAWAASMRCPASSRANTPSGCGSSWSSPPTPARSRRTTTRTETLVVLCLALAAALAIKVPALFGLQLGR